MTGSQDRLRWLEKVSAAEGEDDPLVFFSGADVQQTKGDFGVDLRDLDDFWPLAERLQARSARPGPLVVFTDVAGDPVPRALAVATTARLLSESNHRVLMVDADFAREGLGPRLQLEEEEGLVDLLLYGASPGATCRPSSMKGVDVLGVGSFRPDDTDEIDDEVLHRGFAQLRASYDLILMAAPALLTDGTYNSLLVHADGLVLTPTRGSEASDAQALVEYLRGQVLPVWGAVAFTTPEEARERAIGVLDPQDGPTVHRIEGQSSSPLFRRLTLGLAGALVLFLAWWGGTQLLSKDTSDRGPAQIAAEAVRNTPRVADPVTTAPESTAAQPDPTEGGLVVAEPENEPDSPAGSTQARPEVVQGEEADPSVSEPDRADVAPATPPDSPADAASRSAEPPADRAEPTLPPEPASAWATQVKLTPRDGWSLHLWSFPDSMEAVVAGRKLEREGYAPRAVSALIQGRTWYRVVVGRFARRADAMEARTILGQRPDVEYVGVVRVH